MRERERERRLSANNSVSSEGRKRWRARSDRHRSSNERFPPSNSDVSTRGMLPSLFIHSTKASSSLASSQNTGAVSLSLSLSLSLCVSLSVSLSLSPYTSSSHCPVRMNSFSSPPSNGERQRERGAKRQCHPSLHPLSPPYPLHLSPLAATGERERRRETSRNSRAVRSTSAIDAPSRLPLSLSLSLALSLSVVSLSLSLSSSPSQWGEQ